MISIIEKEGSVENFDFAVKLYKDGHRCGYVRIPENHPLYNQDYSKIDVECHGGLTFSKLITIENSFLPKGFWIGFDCQHCFDLPDVESVKKVWGKYEENDYWGWGDGEVRSLDYVESECRGIINQIKTM